MIGKKLSFHDTVGIISPASPENMDSIDKGVKILTNLGFVVKKGKYLSNHQGYLSGSDAERSEDLMEMFLDKSVKMILCVRGGYGTMRTLPLIDFDVIKSNPKIFVGYSDITTYLNSFYAKCGLITFHGPMLSSKLDDNITLKSLLDILMKGDNIYKISNPNNIPAKSNSCSIVDGVLIGGNLSLICSTLSTPYEIDTTDKIIFLEDIGEEPYKIDRMLTQLLLANKLQVCRGIILGQFTNCHLLSYSRSLTLEEVINDRILSLNIPTLYNFMSGHDYPKLTLPIGAKVQLDCKNCFVRTLESVVL